MNRKLSAMSQRYGKALKSHLQHNPLSGLKVALRLGHQAVALGIQTWGLALIHERALKRSATFKPNGGLLARAETFFYEAMRPIMESHRNGRQTTLQWERVNKELKQRTAELAATNLRLQSGVTQRKGVESALRKQSARDTRLLKESLRSQESLRQLAHQVMVTQEEERKRLSHQLQDEIAQDLLGVNVRLLSLKQQTRLSSKHLGNEIASTRRLVAESARALRRVAQKIRKS
jgi:signal transduction histidine kinase